MKILIVQETDWLERNPVHHHHLAEMLSLWGHEIRVIDHKILWRRDRRGLSSKREIFNNVSKVYQGARVTVIRPGTIKIAVLDYVSLVFYHKKEIERQIREFCPDILIGFSILNSYLARIAAKKANIPFVYYWMDVLHRLIPEKLFQPIAKVMESKTLRQADRVLVINERLKEYIVKMRIPPDRIHVLRAGIDIERFNPNTSGNAIRKQYGFSKEDIILFFMGWLYDFSGLKEVALQLARMKNHNIKLLIVGEGDAYEELQKIREKYNLEGRFVLCGKKPYQEIPAFIAAADICLLPAHPWEPIMQDIVPIKMYEYMAMKKPVISTKLPGVLGEFGEDNGVVYVDKPENTLTKAMELIQNNRVKELGERARRFVERYSWDNITGEFERILIETVAQKRL